VNITAATNKNNDTEFKIKSGPNPTDGIVTLQVLNTNTDNLEFRISNVFNVVVKTFSAPSETVIFDISDFDIGVYYLQLIRNGQILQTKKIIRR
jgi:hypothetical protein